MSPAAPALEGARSLARGARSAAAPPDPSAALVALLRARGHGGVAAVAGRRRGGRAAAGARARVRAPAEACAAGRGRPVPRGGGIARPLSTAAGRGGGRHRRGRRVGGDGGGRRRGSRRGGGARSPWSTTMACHGRGCGLPSKRLVRSYRFARCVQASPVPQAVAGVVCRKRALSS